MSRELQIMEIPCGRGGINRSSNLSDFPLTDLRFDDTITSESDTWRKEGGASKINTTSIGASASVLGAWDFFSGAGVQELVAYTDDGATAQLVTVSTTGVVKTLKSGLQTGKFPVFAEGYDGATKALYIANGHNRIQVYTGGANTTDLPNPNADWEPTAGVFGNHPAVVIPHRARLFALNPANFPHDIFGSLAAKHGDFTSPENFRQPVHPGEWMGIRAGVSWGERLYLFKYPLGIYYLDDRDPNLGNWQVVKVSDAFGVAGPGCVVPIEDDVIIWATDGYFYALSQVRTDGQVSAPPVLPVETGDFIRNQVNLQRQHQVQGIWYGHKRQVMFACPGTGSTVNNRRIVGDLHTPGAPKFHFSRRDTCPALSLRRASATEVRKPIMGDSAGFLWALDQANRNKDGVAYRAQFEGPPVALYPKGIRRGNLAEIELVFQEQGNWDLTLEVHRDGVLSQTLTFSMQSLGTASGSISLDSDVLGGMTVANVRRRATGDARRVKYIGYNDGLNQDFSIASILTKYSPGTTR